MKWFKFVACSMLLATLGYAEDTKKPVEWSVGAEYLIPGDDDTWDAAYGGTAKAIFWQQGSFGVALSLGVQQWKSKEIDELYELTDLGNDYYYASGVTFEGEAITIPVGLSGVYRKDLNKGRRINFEAGLKYVVVDSDIKLSYYEAVYDALYDEVVDGYVDEDKVEIDDGVVGFIGVDLLLPIDKIVGFIGAGYQFDISKGKGKWRGEEVGENELKAAFVRAGIAF